ncbi:hypothetical protein T484DRAFT_1949591 [Baffinella frigidus]|nr:hypothetical protein T484DRAFT_1949591 [Cryptophyta sp. CCMP2293]
MTTRTYLRLAHVDLLEASVDGVSGEVAREVAVPPQRAADVVVQLACTGWGGRVTRPLRLFPVVPALSCSIPRSPRHFPNRRTTAPPHHRTTATLSSETTSNTASQQRSNCCLRVRPNSANRPAHSTPKPDKQGNQPKQLPPLPNPTVFFQALGSTSNPIVSIQALRQHTCFIPRTNRKKKKRTHGLLTVDTEVERLAGTRLADGEGATGLKALLGEQRRREACVRKTANT